MEKRTLRILYTVNAGHYILARSPSPIEVTLINTSPDGSGDARYGSVPLKRCLSIICQSSPEIFQDLYQDSTRDFSVYLLDPLEADTAPEQVNIADNGESSRAAVTQGRGVAVGMGLMSWGLESEESEEACANGTLTKLPNGSVALEVVLALRETVRMSKKALPGAKKQAPKRAARDPETVATIQAIRARQAREASLPPPKPKPQPKTEPPPKIRTEADKIYYNANIRINPSKTKPVQHGRPWPSAPPSRSSFTTRSISLPVAVTPMPQASTSRLGGPAELASDPFTSSASTSPAAATPPTVLKIPKPSHAAFTNQPLRRAPAPHLWPKPATPPPQPIDPSIVPQLLSILTGTPASEAHLPQNAALLAALGSIDANTSGDGNSGLLRALQVLLSSTPPEASSQSPPPPPPPHAPESTPTDKENVNPTVSRRRPSEGKPTSLSATASSPPAADTTVGSADTVGRKRTLSDFLESNTTRLGQEPFTSPVRPPPSRRIATGSIGQPIFIPDSPKPSRISASSPVKPPPTQPRKYVIPDWARTDTALKPRLSNTASQLEEIKRAEQEKQRLEKEQKAREKRREMRKKKVDTLSSDVTASSEDASPSPSDASTPPVAATPAPQTPPASPRASLTSVVSAYGNHAISSIFSTPKRTRSSRISPATPVPCTPPRRRDNPQSSSTPLSSSLFTPLGWGTPLAGGGDAIFSPLSTKTLTIIKPNAEEEDGDDKMTETNGTPSSIPVASDDEDVPTSGTKPEDDSTMEADRKEFWAGLPPSSPMQASSPLLPELGLPDVDEDDIPIATSEAGFDTDTPLLDDEEMGDPTSEMDVLDMFTNLNSMASDDFSPPENVNALSDLDFTEEFWASVGGKPLIGGGGEQEGGLDFGFGSLDHDEPVDGILDPPFDPAQLAEQVQTLFSGCLM